MLHSQFTMEGHSSKPYAWMLEGDFDLAQIAEVGVHEWTNEYVNTVINAVNYEEKDEIVYEEWKRESGEFELIVKYVSQVIVNELRINSFDAIRIDDNTTIIVWFGTDELDDDVEKMLIDGKQLKFSWWGYIEDTSNGVSETDNISGESRDDIIDDLKDIIENTD